MPQVFSRKGNAIWFEGCDRPNSRRQFAASVCGVRSQRPFAASVRGVRSRRPFAASVPDVRPHTGILGTYVVAGCKDHSVDGVLLAVLEDDRRRTELAHVWAHRERLKNMDRRGRWCRCRVSATPDGRCASAPARPYARVDAADQVVVDGWMRLVEMVLGLQAVQPQVDLALELLLDHAVHDQVHERAVWDSKPRCRIRLGRGGDAGERAPRLR